ncbi:MAG: hypothetical protein HRU19_13575 [Pseudobacteriovorax sp.]|nr:hypothetical protein [Pseudobacteriovorax sp.]
MKILLFSFCFFILALGRGHTAEARIQEMTDAINQIRSQAGLGQLYWDDALMTAAFVHSRGMAELGYCNHGGLYERVYTYGWRGYGIGEIVSCGADNHWTAIYRWLNSPGHRQNLLNGYYNHVGISHYYGRAGHRWTVIFGRR